MTITGDTFQGDARRYKTSYLTPFAIPANTSNTTIQQLSSLTTQILAQKQRDPTANTTALEAEIDVLVYKLYGLSYGEVLVVDPEFEMGESEYAKIEVV